MSRLGRKSPLFSNGYKYEQEHTYGLPAVSKLADIDSDVIYTNILFPYTQPPGQAPGTSIPVNYTEERTTPILQNPSDYYVSVIRFTIPGTTIPIMIFPIQTNQSNINLSTLSITLTLNAEVQQIFLTFVPFVNFPAPPGPVGNEQVNSPYYYVYDYNHVILMINAALATAFAALTGKPAGSLAPYLILDPNNNLISLVTTRAGYTFNPLTNISPPANIIGIYINTPLSTLLQFLPNKFIGYDAPNGTNAWLIVTDLFDNAYTPPNIAPTFPSLYLRMTQEALSLDLWNSCNSIVFQTGNIPIQYEYVPNTDIGNLTQASNDNFRPVLTDFSPILDDPHDTQSIFNYFVSGPYRITSLKSTNPLYKIDLQLYWQDKKNNLYPLTIVEGNTVSVKLMFIKKSLYGRLTSHNL